MSSTKLFAYYFYLSHSMAMPQDDDIPFMGIFLIYSKSKYLTKPSNYLSIRRGDGFIKKYTEIQRIVSSYTHEIDCIDFLYMDSNRQNFLFYR